MEQSKEERMKNWIDSNSYETLLNKWRFAPDGDEFLQGEIGEYYSKVMFEKCDALSDDERVKVSKRVGL